MSDENKFTLEDGLVAVPADKFKIALLQWWAESEHQCWDGFSDEEVRAFKCLMWDFVTYCENGGLEDVPGSFSFGSHRIAVSGNGDVDVSTE